MVTFLGERFAIRQTEYRNAYDVGVVSGVVTVSASTSASVALALDFLFGGSGGASWAGSKYRMRPQELHVTICSLLRISCQVCGLNITKQARHFWSRASEMADLRCR